MAVLFSDFGKLKDGTPVTAATITNHCGASLTILDYGATVQSLRIPNREGAPVDVVLGYDSPEEYVLHGEYLGATIGRVGNRIAGAEFSLNGIRYQLARNDGENHLHGGREGFDRKVWRMAAQGESLLCWRTSPDGEEGYPGTLEVRVCFTLTEENAFRIEYDADTDADTLVNLTNHCYFNLNGQGSVLGHRLQLFAERFCENGKGCLPTGKLLPVENTPFDFRHEKTLGAEIDAGDEQLLIAGGYDHNYVLCGKKAAVLYSPDSGIEMTVETDMPGMQLYTGNFLPECRGKSGTQIQRRSAACFETQLYPNGMNCYGFPSPVLRAGSHLHSETAYIFRLRG